MATHHATGTQQQAPRAERRRRPGRLSRRGVHVAWARQPRLRARLVARAVAAPGSRRPARAAVCLRGDAGARVSASADASAADARAQCRLQQLARRPQRDSLPQGRLDSARPGDPVCRCGHVARAVRAGPRHRSGRRCERFARRSRRHVFSDATSQLGPAPRSGRAGRIRDLRRRKSHRPARYVLSRRHVQRTGRRRPARVGGPARVPRVRPVACAPHESRRHRRERRGPDGERGVTPARADALRPLGAVQRQPLPARVPAVRIRADSRDDAATRRRR